MLILGGLQGTEYHDDFARACGLELLAPGATVVADRLLDPMAPEFLWQLSPTLGLFEETFAVEMEDDWVVIAMGLQERRLPEVPEEVTQMRFAADEARRRTTAWRYRDRLVAGPARDELEVEEMRSFLREQVSNGIYHPLLSRGLRDDEFI